MIRNDRDLEDYVNDSLSLSKTKGSGSVHGDGDGKGWSKQHSSWNLLLAEAKFTEHRRKSVSIRKKDFDKTNLSARRLGRVPMMSTYQLGDDDVFVHLTLDDFEVIYKNHLEYTKDKQE
jgi:hypothetical protein